MSDRTATEQSRTIGAGTDDDRPFRLGLLLHVDGDVPPRQAYRDAIDLVVQAEEAGYDSVWVVARHFRQGNEHISAPLVALAAMAEHTSRIRLGTAVLVLPLEDPVRVAEDAAVLDALSGGRLELGIGSGPFPGAWEAFGRDLADRHPLFGESVARLHEVLEGAPLNSLGETLHPPAPGVRSRLWQATSGDPTVARESVIAAARAGDGLQLSRATDWSRNQGEQDQADLVTAYRDAWARPDRPPRILVSRAVYPHADESTALAALTPGAARWQQWLGRLGHHGVAEATAEEFLDRDHTRFGSPERIAEGLARDPALREATDLLVSFVPGAPDHAEHLRLIRDTADQIAPHLGWRPL
ncbi:MAG: alkane 1-monooxygenase [Frondihabitans sp.]|nr:alkane 1-monooxygenase [Frondihabitans sp.]